MQNAKCKLQNGFARAASVIERCDDCALSADWKSAIQQIRKSALRKSAKCKSQNRAAFVIGSALALMASVALCGCERTASSGFESKLFERVEVMGKRVRKLLARFVGVLKVLVDAYPSGVSGPQLDDRSGYSQDSRKYLRELQDCHPEFARVIAYPRARNRGGYRLVWPEAAPPPARPSYPDTRDPADDPG